MLKDLVCLPCLEKPCSHCQFVTKEIRQGLETTVSLWHSDSLTLTFSQNHFNPLDRDLAAESGCIERYETLEN